MSKRRPGHRAALQDRKRRNNGPVDIDDLHFARNSIALALWSALRDPDLDIDRPTCRRRHCCRVVSVCLSAIFQSDLPIRDEDHNGIEIR